MRVSTKCIIYGHHSTLNPLATVKVLSCNVPNENGRHGMGLKADGKETQTVYRIKIGGIVIGFAK